MSEYLQPELLTIELFKKLKYDQLDTREQRANSTRDLVVFINILTLAVSEAKK